MMTFKFRKAFYSSLAGKLVFLFFVICGPEVLFARNDPSKTNVLYLNSYQVGYNWSDSITKGVITGLAGHPKVVVYTEFMDAKRFGTAFYPAFLDYLKVKYKDLRIDAVITSDNDALDFMMIYGDSVRPKVPVVFCGINDPENYSFQNTRFYGVLESANSGSELKLVRRLLPNSQNILILLDETTSGKVYRRQFEEAVKQFKQLNLTFKSQIDQEELLEELKSAALHWDAIVLSGVHQDKYGNPVNDLEFSERVGKVSPIPVFYNEDELRGKGIVGGMAYRGFLQGQKAAKILLQILHAPANEFPPHLNYVDEGYVFDGKLLNKYNINRKNLPPNSVIIRGHIRLYLEELLLLSVIVAILSIIIIILLAINRARRVAEKTIVNQLNEIKEKNLMIESAYVQLNNMNRELEAMNNRLTAHNARLSSEKNAAVEADKLKSAFLANLSHEIRTPLNSIIGFSSLMQQYEFPANYENCRAYVRYIADGGETLMRLIDDIIDISKIEVGQLKVDIQAVNVNAILFELYQFYNSYRVLKRKQNIQFLYVPDRKVDQPALITDGSRLRQIIVNLLENAFKFTSEGHVKFGYQINQDAYHFFVEDTGIGIKDDQQQIVFESFTKVKHDDGKIYDGTGLGLAIVRKLVVMLNGEIGVESTLGKGSRFYFIIPISSVN
jgi:signal transduction histidine kinase